MKFCFVFETLTAIPQKQSEYENMRVKCVSHKVGNADLHNIPQSVHLKAVADCREETSTN
jgi:hypothetical protein